MISFQSWHFRAFWVSSFEIGCCVLLLDGLKGMKQNNKEYGNLPYPETLTCNYSKPPLRVSYCMVMRPAPLLQILKSFGWMLHHPPYHQMRTTNVQWHRRQKKKKAYFGVWDESGQTFFCLKFKYGLWPLVIEKVSSPVSTLFASLINNLTEK